MAVKRCIAPFDRPEGPCEPILPLGLYIFPRLVEQPGIFLLVDVPWENSYNDA